jgi:23S rRNA pseudouridine1911/1915/1917 synthase
LTDQSFSFTVSNDQKGRLDKFLANQFPEQSRTRLQGLIRVGTVKVNGVVIQKTGYSLVGLENVDITIPEIVGTELIAENIPLEVLFENSDLAMINKPAGMVVHPAAGHSTGTMVHAALGQFDDLEGIGGELRPGIVHRLDKDTSGLIVIAKNDQSLRWLQDQFRLHKVQKFYIALVDGKPPTPTGRVEAAIARDPSHRKKMAVVSEMRGRQSVTEYKTLTEYAHHTLVEAHPLTGRTHQIRLHMAFIKCPIVGDTVYGRSHPSVEIDRHFLHAARLMITLPGEEKPRTFEAELPIELQEVLELVK